MIGIGIGIDYTSPDGSNGTPPGQVPILLIVAGQSNAGKEGTQGNTPPAKYDSLGLKIWNNSGAFVDYDPASNPGDYGSAWGTEAEFVHQLRQAGSTRPVYMVKRSQGGTPVNAEAGNDWHPASGELFDQLKSRVIAARAEIVALEGQNPEEITLWNQGERDIQSNTRAAAYAANMASFMDAYRAQISTGLFILERTRPFPGWYDNGFTIRQAQLDEVAADASAVAVDCDFIATDPWSELHPGPDWCEGIGARAYAAWEGSYSATYGDILDAVPDAFSFAALTNQTPGATVMSEVITPDGFERDCTVAVTGGEYCITNPDDTVAAPWTSSPGRLHRWQKIQLRTDTSGSNSTATNVVLTLGGIASTWTVTTEADAVPDPFTFTDQTDVAPGAVVISTPITVTGLAVPAAISVSGGAYRINGEAFTTGSGSVSNGDSVEVRVTASAGHNTTVSATLTIGGVSDDFDVTTEAAPADTVPDTFAFTDATDQPVSTVVASDVITPAGYTGVAAISVTGGEYRIDGGTWTAAAGNISPGQSVQLRGTSSASNATTVDVVLIIGGVSDTFSITTEAAAPVGVASLFASGEEGAWYDPSDLSTLWQDVAGTMPVTSDGDPVALMQDKSGNGHHLSIATASARPTYRTSGGLHWLEFDGADDTLANEATRFGMADNPDVTVVTAQRTFSSSYSAEWVFTIGSSSTNGTLNASVGSLGYAWLYGAGNEIYSPVTTGTDHVCAWVHPAGGTYAASSFYLDGSEAAATGSTNPTRSVNGGGLGFRLANRRGVASEYAHMRLYGMVVLDSSDAPRRQVAESWAAGLI